VAVEASHFQQEAQLSLWNHATRYVIWNLVNRCTTVLQTRTRLTVFSCSDTSPT